MVAKGSDLQVMLLTATGSDDTLVVVTALSEIVEGIPGHFSRLVSVNQGQGVAFDGQILQADYNHERRRWQVLHPCA